MSLIPLTHTLAQLCKECYKTLGIVSTFNTDMLRHCILDMSYDNLHLAYSHPANGTAAHILVWSCLLQLAVFAHEQDFKILAFIFVPCFIEVRYVIFLLIKPYHTIPYQLCCIASMHVRVFLFFNCK